MTQPDPETGEEVARVKAIQDNAARLGLTWGLRPATVTSTDPVQARYDGDSESIGMVSMIGSPGVGERVYAIRIPPSGNYIAGYVDTGWVIPTLLNSWADFGSGFQSARFRISAGQVEIQGLVTGGTGPASTVFTLPVGYRPPAALLFATIANNAIARLDVEADGDVVWQAGGTNAFLSLNCAFRL